MEIDVNIETIIINFLKEKGVVDLTNTLKKQKRNEYQLSLRKRLRILNEIKKNPNELGVYLIDKDKFEFIISNKKKHILFNKNLTILLNEDLTPILKIMGSLIHSDNFSYSNQHKQLTIKYDSIYGKTILFKNDNNLDNYSFSITGYGKVTNLSIVDSNYVLHVENSPYSELTLDNNFNPIQFIVSDYLSKKLGMKNKVFNNISFKDFQSEIQSYIDIYSLVNDKIINNISPELFFKQIDFVKDVIKNKNIIDNNEVSSLFNDIISYFMDKHFLKNYNKNTLDFHNDFVKEIKKIPNYEQKTSMEEIDLINYQQKVISQNHSKMILELLESTKNEDLLLNSDIFSKTLNLIKIIEEKTKLLSTPNLKKTLKEVKHVY